MSGPCPCALHPMSPHVTPCQVPAHVLRTPCHPMSGPCPCAPHPMSPHVTPCHPMSGPCPCQVPAHVLRTPCHPMSGPCPCQAPHVSSLPMRSAGPMHNHTHFPVVGGILSAMRLSSVDLPAPFGPTMPMRSPALARKWAGKNCGHLSTLQLPFGLKGFRVYHKHHTPLDYKGSGSTISIIHLLMVIVACALFAGWQAGRQSCLKIRQPGDLYCKWLPGLYHAGFITCLFTHKR